MTSLMEQREEIERLRQVLQGQVDRADKFELKYLRLVVEVRRIAEGLKHGRDTWSARSEDAAELLAAIGE